MAKDPAFLFYSQDFIVGTNTMDFEDRGKYITILAQMHQEGRMDEETIRFLVGNVSDKLKKKFLIDENGLWYNKRLEEETEKRASFVDSRRNNGMKGGRPKNTETKPNGKPNGSAKNNLHEDVNENENNIEYGIDSEIFKKQWMRWKRYLNDQHNFEYLSIDSEQTSIEKLIRLAQSNEKQAIEIINHTISMGWKGFYGNSKTEVEQKEQPKPGYFKKLPVPDER